MIGRVSVKYCSTRPMTLLWPIRIGFCPSSGGGPHRQDYSIHLAEESLPAKRCRQRRSHRPEARDHERTTTTSSALCMYENSHGWPILLRLSRRLDCSRRIAAADSATRTEVLPRRCS